MPSRATAFRAGTTAFRAGAVALGGALLAQMAGCGTAGIERSPARPSIVSLIPQVTELILELGGGDHLVGRTTGAEDPELHDIPAAGHPTDPDAEAIAWLDPDLVVGWRGANPAPLRAAIRSGSRLWLTESETLGDLWRNLGRVGEELDRSRAADSLRRHLAGGLDEVRRAVADREARRAVLVIWDDPPVVAGRGTYLDELLRIAGGLNAFADGPVPWPRVGFEALVARDPDVVLRLHRTGSARALIDHPGWRLVPAVLDGRTHPLPDRLFGRAGVRVVDAAWHLAALLHPDLDVPDAARPGAPALFDPEEDP